jgi:hypothetical protein
LLLCDSIFNVQWHFSFKSNRFFCDNYSKPKLTTQNS